MKTRTLLLALAAAFSTAVTLPALAAQGQAPSPSAVSAAARAPLDLQGAVDLVAGTYPGRVVAAQADPTGGEGLHFHVDTLLPHGRVARFDVDAGTHRIYNRLPAEEAPEGVLSLNEAVKKVRNEIRGDVVAAEFDPDPQPHYHMSVRLPGGQFTRLDLDLATGKAVKHMPRS